MPVELLRGFAVVAKHAAQGAALVADGLAGGTAAPLVETLGVREASGTALDNGVAHFTGATTGTSSYVTAGSISY